MSRITTTALRARWRDSDRWLSDGGSRGAGRLTARITGDGVLLYYQYFCEGRLQRVRSAHTMRLGLADCHSFRRARNPRPWLRAIVRV